MLHSFKSLVVGGQEGPRPIISIKLLLHLSFANTIIVVSQEFQDCCHYYLPFDPQVPSPILRARAANLVKECFQASPQCHLHTLVVCFLAFLSHKLLCLLPLQRQQCFCIRIVRLTSLLLFILGPCLHLQRISQRGTKGKRGILKIVGLQGSWIS